MVNLQFTGTTTENILHCVKFPLLDYKQTKGIATVIYKRLGVPILWPSLDALEKKSVKEKKKVCKALGYGEITKKNELNNVLSSQHPNVKLVYSKCVKNWCMAPIKQKS